MPQTTPEYDRTSIADALLERLDEPTLAEARRQFASPTQTRWFSVDDLLPDVMARAIHAAFPAPSAMRERKTLREHKYVAAQMDRYAPLGEEALFAFQDPRIIERVATITGMTSLHADPLLYAGGLSLMGRGNFLNPHLDNSHNNDRSLYRVLNLLYYATPGWQQDNGGNLELWPAGTRAEPLTIVSRFNRLVVMTTGPESWHSVSTVRVDVPRCCVSNYYFSEYPVGDKEYFRVTTFRGRPEQPIRDMVLRADAALRQGIRALKPAGLVRTTHLYERKQPPK
jgi:Rps23 Pro-64 3,4-dihydroxylase Tpa1-like proline 4-hydroxylase